MGFSMALVFAGFWGLVLKESEALSLGSVLQGAQQDTCRGFRFSVLALEVLGGSANLLLVFRG